MLHSGSKNIHVRKNFLSQGFGAEWAYLHHIPGRAIGAASKEGNGAGGLEVAQFSGKLHMEKDVGANENRWKK